MDSACVGNDALLLDRYPDIAFHLNFVPYEPFALVQNPDQNWNAIRKGENLHAENVEKEIARFLSRCKLDDVEIFYLYGMGLGHHYEALKEWLSEKKERLLIVLEEDLGVLAAFLFCPLAEEILAHPRVHIRFFSSPHALSDLMKELVATFPSERVECAAIASYAKKKRHILQKIQAQLYRFTAVSHALMTEALYCHKLIENILANILKWPDSFFANGLKKRFSGIPAIICGAGPSLSHTFEQLKAINDRALIIAGGSTISALSNQGILPHLGLAVDPNPEEFDRLKAASSFAMPLIYATRLEPRVFNTCNGERGYLLSETGGSCETHFEKAVGIEEESIGPELGAEAFSVTTLCIALAVEMGCDPIILNGIDLSYTHMQRYAEGVLPSSKIFLDEIQGTKKASERLLKRKDIFGNPVYTLVKWVMEAECIAAYAKKHPECRFINATSGGLGFAKIPNQSLSEILTTHCTEQRDLSALLHGIFQEKKLSTLSSDVLQAIEKVRESLLRLQGIASQIAQEVERLKSHPTLAVPSGKLTILEIDFQEEIAFTCLFLVLGPSLERLLNRAYYFSPLLSEEERRRMQLERYSAKWTKWQEMIASEIAFLNRPLRN
ncbi:MAG TPA: 6-hydroxymethylpterin diphosphokinase MptE-like protein [Rhabdochlamydiaceae bacterium]|jgi:hypothetical protein